MTIEPSEASRRPALGQRFGYLRRVASRGEGQADAVAKLLGDLLTGGVLALVLLIPLIYCTGLSDYRVGKTALLYAGIPLLAGIWLARSAALGRLCLERSSLYLPLLVYVAAAVAALALSHNRVVALESLLFQLWLFLLLIVIAHHFCAASPAGVLWCAAGAGSVVVLSGLLQSWGVHVLPRPERLGDLPVATLGNLNFVAHYLEIVIPLIVALILIRTRPWERGLLAVALVGAGAHMMLTSSRAGWLATVVAFLVWIGLLVRRSHVRWLPRLALIVIAVALLSPLVALVLGGIELGEESLYDSMALAASRGWERVLSSFDAGNYSVSQRLIIWGDTLDLIRDHPFLGVGSGNYEALLPLYRTAARHRASQEVMGFRNVVADYAHNEYLELWAETGVFGMLAALWLFAALLWMGGRYVATQSDAASRAATLGCLAAMVATLTHSLFSFNLQDPTAALHFWLLAGLMIAVNSVRPATCLVDLSLHTRWRRALVVCGGVALSVIGLYTGLSLLLGDFYYARGVRQSRSYTRASPALRQAIDWRGHDYRYHYVLGLVSLESGQYAEAEAALRRSLELHPNNARALRLLGRTLHSVQRGPEAVPILRQAARLDPLAQKTYKMLALTYRQQRDHANAVQAWLQALAFAPEDAQLMTSLGLEYVYAGQAEQAVAVLDRANRLQPGAGAILGNLGAAQLQLASIHLRQGQPVEAGSALQAGRVALSQALELMPGEAEWEKNLANLEILQRRLEEAK